MYIQGTDKIRGTLVIPHMSQKCRLKKGMSSLITPEDLQNKDLQRAIKSKKVVLFGDDGKLKSLPKSNLIEFKNVTKRKMVIPGVQGTKRAAPNGILGFTRSELQLPNIQALINAGKIVPVKKQKKAKKGQLDLGLFHSQMEMDLETDTQKQKEVERVEGEEISEGDTPEEAVMKANAQDEAIKDDKGVVWNVKPDVLEEDKPELEPEPETDVESEKPRAVVANPGDSRINTIKGAKVFDITEDAVYNSELGAYVPDDSSHQEETTKMADSTEASQDESYVAENVPTKFHIADPTSESEPTMENAHVYDPANDQVIISGENNATEDLR